MNCEEAVKYIHSLEKFGIKPGLERIEAICEALGNPQKSLKFAHVAGTNGKGSTSTMLSGILVSAGYNTGLFTSPYVTDFRERIQINGEMIEPDELADVVTRVKAAVDLLNLKGIVPTEFEVLTATAMLYYEMKKCDIVVLEVGLGGRLDSTNVIDCPVVNVLTSISMDHVAVLGDTLEKIANEKCGTLKQNGVCVCYPEQDEAVFRVIKDVCKKLNNTLVIPEIGKVENTEINIDGTFFTYSGQKFKTKLTGKHIVKNAVTAIEAARVLSLSGFDISFENIKSGLEKTIMPARMELLCKKPLVLLDGGHNEGCAKAVYQFLNENLKEYKITAVVSMMADKDYNRYLEIVSPCFEKIIAAFTDVPRALSAADMKKAAGKFCDNCDIIEKPVNSLDEIFKNHCVNDAFIFCGSFYFAGEIRNKLIDYLRCNYD